MIVNTSKKGYHIIDHAAHGMLSGNIGRYIDFKYFPKQWFETIIAITEHDDRQLNFDEKNYLSELGIPLDFTENSATANQVLKRMKLVIDAVKVKSSWVRLLVSFHLEFLYSDLAEKSKKVSDFLKKEKECRKQILDTYNLKYSQGENYYQILKFCDRLSLILCKNQVPNLGRTIEINNSINGDTYFASRLKNGDITITPWIFIKDEFTISMEEKILNVSSFDSNKSFEKTLNQTQPRLIEWTFRKEGS